MKSIENAQKRTVRPLAWTGTLRRARAIRTSIRLKFMLALGLVAAFSVALITFTQAASQIEDLRGQAFAHSRLATLLLASQTDEAVGNAFEELAVVAADPSFVALVEAQDVNSLNARLESMGLAEPDFTAMAAFNTDARMRGISLTDKTLIDRDYSQQRQVSIPLSLGVPGIGVPRPGLVTGRPILPLGVPVRTSDGHIVGALQGSLSLEELTDQVQAVHLGARGRITLLNNDGTILVHPDESLILTQYPGASGAIDNSRRTGQPYSIEAVGETGERVLVTAVPSRSLGWFVVAEIPLDQALEPLHSRMREVALVGLIVLFAAAGLGAMMAGWLTAPIARLRDATRAMARGDYAAGSLVIASRDELEDLASDFEAMVVAVQEAETRYRTVSELTSDFSYAFSVAEDWTLTPIWVTNAFTRITGYTPDEFAAKGGWYGITHPDDAFLARERREMLVAGESYVSEFRIYTKAGDIRTLRVHSRPMWDETLRRVVCIYGAAQDITNARRLEQQLLRQNEELERQYRQLKEANRLKSEFLANMSHELRTPLNGIIGFAELMHDEKLGPTSPEHKECLGDILASSRHLLTLINDVLDLAKVESGKMGFNMEHVSLGSLISEVRDILRTLAANKQINLDVEVAPEVSDVVADPARLKQVLYNYLSNAIKFTPDRGHVHVRVLPEGSDHYRIEVEDSGIGIAPEDLGRLFSEFEQLDAGAAKRYQGTGLGLALTKRLVEAQGGSVGVRSAVDVGSTFHATLPRVPVSAGASDGSIELTPSPAVDDDTFHDLSSETPDETPIVPLLPRVLVVEDNPADRGWMAEVLGAAGYDPVAVSSGTEAIALCHRNAFDVVALDLLLPDMTGAEVLARIRSEGLNQETPVVVVTVLAQPDLDRRFAIQDCLLKPASEDDLLAAVERALAQPHRGGAVLVVDDNHENRRLIQVALTAAGYAVISAPDAHAGLRAARENALGAIVLDLVMPGPDGFEFLRQLRRSPRGRPTPVIVVTGKDLNGQDRRRLQSSTQGIVLKGDASTAAVLAQLSAWLPPAAPPEAPEREPAFA